MLKLFYHIWPNDDTVKPVKNGHLEIDKTKILMTNEPGHEISNNVVCATRKASDQPAHTRSLIRAFACCLNILWLLSYWQNIIWSL